MHRFANYVLQKRCLDLCYLESCWNENCQILQVCYAGFVLADFGACIFVSQVFEVPENHVPTLLVNVQKILFMVDNKNLWIAFAQFIYQNLVIRKQFFKLGLMFLNKPDTLSETGGRSENMILDAKDSCIGQRRAFDQILMNIFGVNEPLKVKL